MMKAAQKQICGQTQKLSGTITLGSEGIWLHDAEEVTHERTQALLFRCLYEDQGQWFLSGEKVPVPVTVEDTPYFVVGLTKSHELKLSDGSREPFDPATLHFSAGGEPNCLVKDSCYPARIKRPVYYELMKNLTERQGYFGMEWQGLFYPLKYKNDDTQNQKTDDKTSKRASKKSSLVSRKKTNLAKNKKNKKIIR